MSTVVMACCLVAAAVVVVGRPGPVARRLGKRRGLPDLAGRWRRVRSAAGRRPRQAVAAGAGLAAALGFVAGGPVAGIVVAVYAGLAGRAAIRRASRQRARAARTAALDALAALAADLRAGLPPAAAGTEPGDADRLGRLTSSVWRLAEQTGAAAADLVERIEADARAADRAAASAGAQAAGAQATGLLLAALPLGGIGLGAAIGADPLGVLLHTAAGAACAVVGVALQVAGLLWTERLLAGVVR